MLETIRIYSKDEKSHNTCNVILTFECVEYSCRDPEFYEKSPYAVLHRVQLEPTPDADLKVDVPLDNSDVREHFESLLSVHCHGYDVHTAVAA
ncbi:hypothetical protein [Psychrobacter sp. BI730]|uniref:hypothetical protein n=1 Tax=Psychrobacter sp. BI730 TaxID=2705463 RepID=UPI0015CD4116|nr:hypothetical protein [Psychrobacter sp. BI730]NYR09570.1 hypothetical protein [Psychrobacter sp. BI730]